jgi:DNA repair exonuclease SbcCD ATPase subunit
MLTQSLNNIKDLRDKISRSLEIYQNNMRINSVDMTTHQYGSEQEYSIYSLIGGIKNILTSISYLVKSHNIFVTISTYSERTSINTHLTNLNSQIQNKQLQQIAATIDQLKIIIRNYCLQIDKERFVDYTNEMDNLRRTAMLLDEEITNTKNRLTESGNLYDEIQKAKTTIDEKLEEIESNKEELETKVDEFVSKFGDFKNLAEKATENEVITATKLEEIKESEDVFNDFIQKIDVREKQLEKQNSSTQDYEKTLIKYSERLQKIEEEAQNLIDKAIQALNYSNATGLSAAFSAQHTIANDKWIKRGWLIGAGVSISVTLLLGIWIVTGWGIDPDIKNPIMSIVGRLSMIPFALLAAIFCANQYVKQKSLIEDYAYKTVLAKSIIAFSEELRTKEPEKYAEYLSTILKEIHQDPLRKRGKEKDEVTLKDTTGLVEKIFDGIKALILNKE